MSDLERLDEALAWMGRRSTFLIRGDTKSGARAIRAVFAAARAYRDLLANGVEPDYEAAAIELHEQDDINPQIKPWHYEAAKAIVDAAVANRLLVAPTTEEER